MNDIGKFLFCQQVTVKEGIVDAYLRIAEEV